MTVNIFRAAHQPSSPLLLPTVWDAASAVIAQQMGAKAVGTSSAALAWSLGYADGGYLPTDVLCDAIARIIAKTKVPVSVDVEDGYSSDAEQVAELVKRLQTLGVVGINIEDGEESPDVLVEKIIAIKQSCGDQLFINARTDVYLRGLASGETAVEETLRRATLYTQAGADGVFVPSLEDTSAIASITKQISLPVNVMTSASSANIQALASAGVSRISFGPHLFLNAYQAYGAQLHAVFPSQTITAFSYNEMNDWTASNA